MFTHEKDDDDEMMIFAQILLAVHKKIHSIKLLNVFTFYSNQKIYYSLLAETGISLRLTNCGVFEEAVKLLFFVCIKINIAFCKKCVLVIYFHVLKFHACNKEMYCMRS